MSDKNIVIVVSICAAVVITLIVCICFYQTKIDSFALQNGYKQSQGWTK